MNAFQLIPRLVQQLIESLYTVCVIYIDDVLFLAYLKLTLKVLNF